MTEVLEGQLSSESAQRLLAIREEMLTLRAQNDLLAVMSTPQGRRFVWGLIEDARVYAPSFAADPLATAYGEGRRAVGLALLYRCQNRATDLYVTALTEALAEQRADAATREAAKAEPTSQENV